MSPTYIPYKRRILNGLAGVLVASLFFVFILFFTDLKKYAVVVLAVFAIFLFFNLRSLILRSRLYLNSVSIKDDNLELEIFENDTFKELLQMSLSESKISITEMFFIFNKVGRNFKLKIESKGTGKYETVFEQYEIGGWDLSKFKEIYGEYCAAKGISYNVKALRRTFF